MAKKPTKKPAKKKAPAPKKKVAAPKKPVKKLVAKPVAKKAAPKKAAAKEVKKPVGKVAAPKGKAPIPPKVAEKANKKAAKGKPVEAVEAEVAAAPEGEEEAPEELILTDAEGRRFCRVRDCDQLAAVEGYCRFHYLLHWKKI